MKGNNFGEELALHSPKLCYFHGSVCCFMCRTHTMKCVLLLSGIIQEKDKIKAMQSSIRSPQCYFCCTGPATFRSAACMLTQHKGAV